MAILEGISVLTLVLSRSDTSHRPAEELEAEFEKKLENALEAAGHRAPVTRLRILSETNWAGRDPDRRASGRSAEDSASAAAEVGPARERPTHELRLDVVEQPWVIAKVARVLARLEVNITWLVSHVLEPVVGQNWPRCAVEMHIHVPETALSDVGPALRSLADSEGWGAITLRPWSLTAGRDG